MGIREAVEIVEESKEVAERIIGKVFGTMNAGYCEDMETRPGGMIWYNFGRTDRCGDHDYFSLEIPEEVLEDPTRERIEAFVAEKERERAVEEAKRKADRERVKKEEEAKRKKARHETYQQLKKEFS